MRMTEGTTRKCKYHIWLTEDELILLSRSSTETDPQAIIKIHKDLYDLIDKKAEKIVGGR